MRNTHYTRTKEDDIIIVAPSSKNGITKEYYDFLVGEINRGIVKYKAVACVSYNKFNYSSYHLISVCNHF